MRKILMALCTVSLFAAFTACSSDDEKKPATPEVAPGTSGIINSIDVNGSPYEVWNWNDSVLTSIVNAANGQEKVHLGYNSNGRVNTITFGSLSFVGIPLSGTLKVSYNGDKIAMLRMERNDNSDIFAAVVNYNGPKIGGATVVLDSSLIFTLFNSILPQILGENTSMSTTNLTLDEVTSNINFEWTGDNVSSLLFASNIQASTTLGDLANLISDFSILGNYGADLQAIAESMPDKPVYFDITLTDTTAYTYDSRKNPYQGLMTQLSVATLSASNVLKETTNRAVNIKVSTTIGVPITVLDRTYPLTAENVTNTYQLYNEGGYPVKVSSSNGETKEFHYKEQ